MKKSYKLFAILLVFVFLLTGCGEDPTPTTASVVTQAVTEASSTQTLASAQSESVTTEVYVETTASTTQPTETIDPTTEETESLQSSFAIHFIDVGQADAALVLCDGEAMLIDGGNAEDSNLLYTYLKKQNVDHLSYVIGTHAHEDHIGGIAGALKYATVGTAYCPTDSYDTKAFENFVKALDQQSVSITVPVYGDSFSLGSAECSVLAVNTDPEDTNNSSIVLRIVYGQTSFLFTGDAEEPVEQAIMDRGDSIGSSVLKVGHHGSESSTGYAWLWNVMPQYAVISVGKDNTYGHPTEAVLSRLRDADVKTFRTDLQGDILCTSDGTAVSFSVNRNPDADVFGSVGENSTQQTQATEITETTAVTEADTGTDYVVNTNSGKFHYPHCSSAEAIKPSNRWDYHGTRDELISKGYEPCKRCDP